MGSPVKPRAVTAFGDGAIGLRVGDDVRPFSCKLVRLRKIDIVNLDDGVMRPCLGAHPVRISINAGPQWEKASMKTVERADI